MSRDEFSFSLPPPGTAGFPLSTHTFFGSYGSARVAAPRIARVKANDRISPSETAARRRNRSPRVSDRASRDD